jgi:hypothetical protein
MTRTETVVETLVYSLLNYMTRLVQPQNILLKCGSDSCHGVIKHANLGYHRTTILPVVLYRRTNLSLILREDRKLKVFDNTVLRNVFWPKQVEITGELR